MIGKILLAIICLIVLFGGAHLLIMDGITGLRTEAVTQAEVVTTDPAVTTADVTLDHELWRDDITFVTSITSSLSESPAATAYDSDTLALTISALAEDSTRTLTIRYTIEREDTIMQALGPFLVVGIFGLIFAAIGYGIWHDRKRR
jgi:hypothetical protein